MKVSQRERVEAISLGTFKRRRDKTAINMQLRTKAVQLREREAGMTQEIYSTFRSSGSPAFGF